MRESWFAMSHFTCAHEYIAMNGSHMVENLNLFFSLSKRWYDKSDKETPEAKSQDAQESIKYYFSHIVNDVSKVN